LNPKKSSVRFHGFLFQEGPQESILMLIKYDVEDQDPTSTLQPVEGMPVCGRLQQVEKKFQQPMKKNQEIEERLHPLLDHRDEIILFVDSELRISSVSPSIEALLGYQPGDIIGRPFPSLVCLAPKDAEQAFVEAKRVLGGEKVSGTEYTFISKDGSQLSCRVRGTPLYGEEGISAMFVAEEVSGCRCMEKEVLQASEREKTSIGHYLHNNLGQQLTGISFLIRVLKMKLLSQSSEEVDDIEEIERFTNEAINHTRHLSRFLYPVDMESKDVTEAFKELAVHSQEMYGVACRFQCEHPVRIRDRSRAVQLYNVAHEAIRIANRHQEIKNLIIDLHAGGNTIELAVKSDGLNFSDGLKEDEEIGLRIMQYRAELMGASLEIKGDDRYGAILICSFEESEP